MSSDVSSIHPNEWFLPGGERAHVLLRGEMSFFNGKTLIMFSEVTRVFFQDHFEKITKASMMAHYRGAGNVWLSHLHKTLSFGLKISLPEKPNHVSLCIVCMHVCTYVWNIVIIVVIIMHKGVFYFPIGLGRLLPSGLIVHLGFLHKQKQFTWVNNGTFQAVPLFFQRVWSWFAFIFPSNSATSTCVPLRHLH